MLQGTRSLWEGTLMLGRIQLIFGRKHVIVGRADNCCIPPAEPATDPKIPEDSDSRTIAMVFAILGIFAPLLEIVPIVIGSFY